MNGFGYFPADDHDEFEDREREFYEGNPDEPEKIDWDELFDVIDFFDYAPVPVEVLLLLDERNQVAGFETLPADNPEFTGATLPVDEDDPFWVWICANEDRLFGGW